MTPETSSPRFLRRPAAAACAAVLLALAACGGGEAPAEAPQQAADTAAAPESRAFTLWQPGEEAALRDEQREADPTADGSTVQLLVRLNPAAVFADGRAAALAAPGNGESGAAAALRASQLAAKAEAVATAAQAVIARSVVQAAPGAVMRQQFSHAVEAFVISVPWGQAEAVAAELARNPAVDAVEPDRAYRVGQATPGVRALDPRAWGVDRIDQRSRTLDGLFRQTLTGSGVSVYVLDTGISPHNEFGSRLAAGFSAINDGRGSADCHGHGTHVAGTAAGATLGVAPAARLVPVRVMDCAGSSAGSSVLAGLDWVAANGTRPGVVNLSLGGAASSTLDAAAQRLVTAGFTVVAAAGNSNVDACTQSPARASGLVTVAASDGNDAKAGFSNWGTCVALSAPGTAIASAGRASPTAVVAMNGTSMAAPHAAGAVALLLQGQPTMSPAQVRQQLLAQASADTVTGVPAGTPRSLLFAGSGGALAPAVKTVVVKGIAMATQVPAVGSWRATAEVRLVDDRGAAVAGAQVSGRFSNATQDAACTTTAAGVCTLTSAAVPWQAVPVLGFAVTGVKGNAIAYVGGGVRAAQVQRPAAPVATVSALSGAMLRSTPTAAAWAPQFTVTLKDDRGALVAGATVRALMQVHAGPAVVGMATVACVTGGTGQCALKWNGPALGAAQTGARLQVLAVQRDFLAYRPGAITTATVGRVQ
jgi:subtilisin family serine protease